MVACAKQEKMINLSDAVN